MSTPVSIAAMVLATSFSLSALPANAQLSRTYVSAATGTDGANCDRPTPCRTFQAAHDKTNPNGEITVLDAGGYGGLTISKPISIVNDGVGEASILVSGGGTGITVNAGTTGSVYLRGITIQGIGFGGGTGMRFASGVNLTMISCVVRGHSGDGIVFAPSDNLVEHNLSISSTLVADNGSHGIHVLSVGTASTIIKAAFNRVEAYGNSGDGILFDSASGSAVITGIAEATVSAGNGGNGFSINGNSYLSNALTVVRSVSSNNHLGFKGSEGFIYVGQSTVMHNTAGASNGYVVTFGDNYSVYNLGSGDGLGAVRGKT